MYQQDFSAAVFVPVQLFADLSPSGLILPLEGPSSVSPAEVNSSASSRAQVAFSFALQVPSMSVGSEDLQAGSPALSLLAENQ